MALRKITAKIKFKKSVPYSLGTFQVLLGCMASGCGTGQCRRWTLPSWRRALLASAARSLHRDRLVPAMNISCLDAIIALS